MTIAMENQATVRRHKGAGIASFFIGVTSVISTLALLFTVGVMRQTGKPTPDVDVIIGLGLISICFVDLIGIGLGIFGTADRSSKKAYPVMGLILNIGSMVLFASLVVIGLYH
jgi:hypothetical protein